MTISGSMSPGGSRMKVGLWFLIRFRSRCPSHTDRLHGAGRSQWLAARYAGLIILVWFHIPAPCEDRELVPHTACMVRMAWQVRRKSGAHHDVKPKTSSVDLTKSSSASPPVAIMIWKIADVHVGECLRMIISLGTVIGNAGQGHESVITADFGNGEAGFVVACIVPLKCYDGDEERTEIPAAR